MCVCAREHMRACISVYTVCVVGVVGGGGMESGDLWVGVEGVRNVHVVLLAYCVCILYMCCCGCEGKG